MNWMSGKIQPGVMEKTTLSVAKVNSDRLKRRPLEPMSGICGALSHHPFEPVRPEIKVGMPRVLPGNLPAKLNPLLL
jgi:hypothetical protein